MSSYGTVPLEDQPPLEEQPHHTILMGGAPPGTVDDASNPKQLQSMHSAVIGGEDSMSHQLMYNPSVREQEQANTQKMLHAAFEKAPPGIVPWLLKLEGCFAWTIVCCECYLPVYARVFGLCFTVAAALPKHELYMLLGGVLCFFGGTYPMTLAAIEAYRQCGGQATSEALQDLWSQYQVAVAAMSNDPDSDKLEGQALLAAKARLVLTATDPGTVDRGWKGVYTAWAAVIATLAVQFAQTVAYGSAIGDFLVKWVTIPMNNVLVHVVPPDLHKWIPNIITYTCKIIAITIAYMIQKIISTFYSAIRGGLLISRNFMHWLREKKLCGNVPDPEESNIDEICGWILAGLGFYFQFTNGFAAPWWIQILLWPLGLTEATLIWAVSSATPAEA